jgi:hypothetical protein
VCTTCAGKVCQHYIPAVYSTNGFEVIIFDLQVMSNIDNTKMAVNCLGKPQIDAGFVCTCQCFACGPGVVIKLGQMDECYEGQYGQFEKSYGELKYSDKNPKEEKKEEKKGMFGW